MWIGTCSRAVRVWVKLGAGVRWGVDARLGNAARGRALLDGVDPGRAGDAVPDLGGTPLEAVRRLEQLLSVLGHAGRFSICTAEKAVIRE